MGYRDEFVATAEVGNFPPNRFGIFDLAGNAWEWSDDWYNASKTQKVFRGGAWDSGDRGFLEACARLSNAPVNFNHNYGFRCVLTTTTPSAAPAAASVPAFTPTQSMWKKVPPENAEMAAQAAANDGWIRADRWHLSATAPDTKFFNGAVRLRFRWEKDGALSLTLRREQVPNGPGQRSVSVQCWHDGRLHLNPVGFHTTSSVEARIVPKPLPGSEGTLEFAVIGNKAVARVNDVVVSTWQVPTDYGAGSFDLGNGYHDHQVAVKDVEYTNLDGVPNPETVLGWEFPASAGTPIPVPADCFAAMRVVEKGGKVTVRTAAGEVKTFTTAGRFQVGEFALETVEFQTGKASEFNDTDMALLTGLPKLKHMHLRSLKVTGAGLAVLKTLPLLEYVSLNANAALRDDDLRLLQECRSLIRLEVYNQPQITSAGLAHIFALGQLRDLGLSNVNLRNEDMGRLAGLRQLQKLNLQGSALSAAALEQLQALPDLDALTLDFNTLDRPVNFTAFPKLVSITAQGLTSEAVKSLASATHLETLIAGSYRPFTAELVTQLSAACPGIKELNLNVDRALPPGTSFTALPKLESLIITVFQGDSLFDDAALLDVAKEGKLKRVYIVSAPRLTSVGIAAFKKLRPDVKIDGAGMPSGSQP